MQKKVMWYFTATTLKFQTYLQLKVRLKVQCQVNDKGTYTNYSHCLFSIHQRFALSPVFAESDLEHDEMVYSFEGSNST